MASKLDDIMAPNRSIMGNLRRMHDGSIWADYQITGLAYGYTSDDRKRATLNHHRNLFRALPNNSVIAGFIAAMDPDMIMARAMVDTDVDRNPAWREECEGKHEHFSSHVRPTERVFTVSFPVVEPDAAGELSVLGGIGGRSRERDRAEMSQAVRRAAEIANKLPPVFHLQPLTASQMVWMWNKALTRGVLPEIFPSAVQSNVSTPAGGFASAHFDEGERNEDVSRWRPSSFTQMLKVSQPDHVGTPQSWQTLLAIESLPLEGLQFPGSEIFHIADRVVVQETINGKEVKIPVDIDWAARIKHTPREQAIARNQKNLRRLNEQVGERDTEVSFAQDTLHQQVAMLAEYNRLLESNDDEIEVGLCPIFAVSATSRSRCQAATHQTVQEFRGDRIKLVAPLGGQRELWAAMNPGGFDLRVVEDYTHVTISEYQAATVPCTTNSVGDSRGPIIAENLSGRRHQPVHSEWWRETVKDASSAVAIAGELGAGKTWLIMYLLFHLVDVGGQFLVIDRTDSGEYERPTATLKRHAIVDLLRPKWSIDPLRVFPAELGVDAAVDLLTPLFECEANSAMGMTLGELLRPEVGVRSMSELLGVLQDGVDKDRGLDGKALPQGWADLHRHLYYWSRRGYARALFDNNLDPLDLDAEGIVIRTNRVEVPTAAEVAAKEPLAPNKVFGRAVYGLSMELGRQAFAMRKSRPAGVALDEAYHVTSTPTGLARTVRLAKDGRKDNISLILGSHDPINDYPAGTGLELIPTRFLMRHTDEGLARRSLQWLGIDPDKNGHILRDLMFNTAPKNPRGKVATGREGEGYMRDARGTIGRIKVLGPSSSIRREAMRTTPPEHREVA